MLSSKRSTNLSISSYISKDFFKNLIVVDNISEKDFKLYIVKMVFRATSYIGVFMCVANVAKLS